MNKENLLKTKYKICWISMLVILLGTIIYPSLMEYADRVSKSTTIITVPNPIIVPEIKPVDVLPEDVILINGGDLKPDNFIFTKDLQMGDSDAEVKKLQEYLNSKGYLVATSGPGSIGQETELFGRGTREALIRFQEDNADIILKPFGLVQGTGFFGKTTRDFINK